MATMRFEVHIDKENATPAPIFNKPSVSSGKAFGVQKSNKLLQPTPRKALYDVNREPQLSSGAMRGKELVSNSNTKSKDSHFNPVKPSSTKTFGSENQPSGLSVKKPSLKKGKEKTSEKTVRLAKPKTEVKVLPKRPPVQTHEEDDGFDSDSIFPRSERLTSYVDKLFSWRPPCLFGSLPDSESEPSDTEDWLHEDLLLEDDLINLPEMPDLPDVELPNLLLELPPMSPTVDDDLPPMSPPVDDDLPPMSPPVDDDLPLPTTDPDHLDSFVDASLAPTPDTSLCFGSLKVLHSSLDLSSQEPNGQ